MRSTLIRPILSIVVLTIAAGAGWAQQPAPPPTKTYSSAADVVALIAKAKADRKDGQATVDENILALAPYSATLEYRTAVSTASLHERRAEMFYVVEGSGTMIIGGKLVNEKRTNAENLSGTGIEGGTAQAIAKGDFIMVPENTAHWFSVINGSLAIMSLHVPRSGPSNP